jgi:5-methylcytosine-specific restriction endonuclease McrA
VKLQILKSRVQMLSSPRVGTLAGQPGVVERKRGNAGVKDRAAIKARDHGLCQECKRKGLLGVLGDVVDHIEPLHLGGSDEARNKELLCHDCHDAKTAREAGNRTRGGV